MPSLWVKLSFNQQSEGLEGANMLKPDLLHKALEFYTSTGMDIVRSILSNNIMVIMRSHLSENITWMKRCYNWLLPSNRNYMKKTYRVQPFVRNPSRQMLWQFVYKLWLNHINTGKVIKCLTIKVKLKTFFMKTLVDKHNQSNNCNLLWGILSKIKHFICFPTLEN